MALSENLEVLYFFSNEKEDLIEIKDLKVDKGEDRDKRYFWFFYDRALDKLNHLKFISMRKDDFQQFRQFDELEISFDSKICQSSSGTEYRSLPSASIKTDLENKIKAFFRKK